MVENIQAFLSQMETAFSTGNPSGLLILCLLAVIADIGIPIPFVLDSILILTAYHSGPLSKSALLIVAALFVGRQIGSAILYLLSRVVGKIFLDWLQRHFPSIGSRLDVFKSRLNHWAPLAVATARLTPGLLQITSVAAGAIRLRYSLFVAGITISSIIYDGILILLGFIAASSPKSSDVNFTIWLLISMLIMVCILWPLLFLVIRRRGKKENWPYRAVKPAKPANKNP
jgi:membrane protein DedA with SNARE-associated domain